MDLFSSILKRRQIRAADRNQRKEFDLTMPKPVGLERSDHRTGKLFRPEATGYCVALPEWKHPDLHLRSLHPQLVDTGGVEYRSDDCGGDRGHASGSLHDGGVR
ncbi:MAG: hypothetical protein ACI93T_001711 [Porticoccaceae bacterium]|jgi:hypothetical protein